MKARAYKNDHPHYAEQGQQVCLSGWFDAFVVGFILAWLALVGYWIIHLFVVPK